MKARHNHRNRPNALVQERERLEVKKLEQEIENLSNVENVQELTNQRENKRMRITLLSILVPMLTVFGTFAMQFKNQQQQLDILYEERKIKASKEINHLVGLLSTKEYPPNRENIMRLSDFGELAIPKIISNLPCRYSKMNLGLFDALEIIYKSVPYEFQEEIIIGVANAFITEIDHSSGWTCRPMLYMHFLLQTKSIEPRHRSLIVQNIDKCKTKSEELADHFGTEFHVKLQRDIQSMILRMN